MFKMEYELRFFIEDSNKFFNRLSELKANTVEQRAFMDIYYEPMHHNLPNGVSLRLRIYEDVAKIIYQKSWIQGHDNIKFKVSEGKVILFSGDINKAKEIVSNLCFKELVTLKKNKLLSITIEDLEFAYDEIESLGAFVEIEAKNVDDLISRAKKFVKIFGIRKYCPNSILETYFKGINNTIQIIDY